MSLCNSESIAVYSVYTLLDNAGAVFYVGFTKNFEIRMYEHKLLQGKNKKKDRIIEKMGRLRVKVKHGLTLEEATSLERRLIKHFRPQLTNKHAGGNFVATQPENKRKRGRVKRRRTCPTCGKKFLHLSRHKCKGDTK